jgi:hypothetical protein
MLILFYCFYELINTTQNIIAITFQYALGIRPLLSQVEM